MVRSNSLPGQVHIRLANLNRRVLVTADIRRTHPTLYKWDESAVLAAWFRPAFVRK